MILVANMICDCRFVADTNCPGLFCSSEDSCDTIHFFTMFFYACCQWPSCFSNVDTFSFYTVSYKPPLARREELPAEPRMTNGCIVYTAGCQSGCTTRFDNRLNEQWLFVQHGCQTALYNWFDNRVERTVCSFNTVVKPVVKPV